MQKAWKNIEVLIKHNAVHRKGFKLAEVRPPFIISQAFQELGELEAAPDDPEELADLLGVLFHYAIKKGWTMEQLEWLLIDKLQLRFTANDNQR